MRKGMGFGLSKRRTGGGIIVPRLDLNGAPIGIDESGTFNEGDSATLFLADATLSDPKLTGIGSLTMTCGGGWGDDGANESIAFDTWTTDSETDLDDTLVVGAITFRLQFVAATGVLTVTNNAGDSFSAAAGQALIRLFEYANAAAPPSEVSRTFTWVATSYDGGGGGGPSGSALLLESGDYLLLEDGSYLLLES